MFDQADLVQIRERIDIVDIVSSFADVRKSGWSYVCRCPFHSDTRPSLTIDPRRQLWKCWPCAIGGDVFSFLMRTGMTFPEAVMYVADRAGVSIKSTDQSVKRESKLPLYDAMQRVVNYYRSLFVGSPAEEYAESRGIDPATALRYGLGYAPDGFRSLASAGLADDVLFKLGVLGRTERGSNYDLMRNRLIVPIHDATGRCVSVSGRDLTGIHGRKYVNGSASPIFEKSSVLYGYHQARASIRSTGESIIVEGYTDVISLASAGIGNVAGVMGTSFTSQHLRLLTPLCNRVILLLDGDSAGLKKANELLGLFVAADIDVRIAVIPNGQDPDEFIRTSGVDALRSIITNSVDAIDYRMSVAFDGVVPTEAARVAAAIDEIIPLLRSLQDSVRRDLVVSTMARWCNVSIEAINGEIRKQRSSRERQALPHLQQQTYAKLTDREVTLFAAMMTSEAALSICIEHINPDNLSDAGRSAYRLFTTVEALGNGTPFDALLANCADSIDLQSLVVRIAERPIDPSDAERVGRETCNRILADANRKMMANMSLDEVLAAKRRVNDVSVSST